MVPTTNNIVCGPVLGFSNFTELSKEPIILLMLPLCAVALAIFATDNTFLETYFIHLSYITLSSWNQKVQTSVFYEAFLPIA